MQPVALSEGRRAFDGNKQLTLGPPISKACDDLSSTAAKIVIGAT